METFYGVRGKSKKILVWSNYRPYGGGLSEVAFTSATSKTATRFTQLNYC